MSKTLVDLQEFYAAKKDADHIKALTTIFTSIFTAFQEAV